MIKNFAIILILVFCEKISSKDEPKLNVPGYGTLTGKIIKTSGLLGRVPKTYYAYRNLTYAKSVSGDKRFSVSKKFWVDFYFLLKYLIFSNRNYLMGLYPTRTMMQPKQDQSVHRVRFLRSSAFLDCPFHSCLNLFG